jgi:hypothetical protein
MPLVMRRARITMFTMCTGGCLAPDRISITVAFSNDVIMMMMMISEAPSNEQTCGAGGERKKKTTHKSHGLKEGFTKCTPYKGATYIDGLSECFFIS